MLQRCNVWTIGKLSLRSSEIDSLFYEITENNQIMEEVHNLLDAASLGNLDDVKQCLDRGMPVDSKDDRKGGNEKCEVYNRVSTISYNPSSTCCLASYFNDAKTSSSGLSSHINGCISHKYSLHYTKHENLKRSTLSFASPQISTQPRRHAK